MHPLREKSENPRVKKILIVDDDADMTFLMSETLHEQHHYQVTVAHNGPDAVARTSKEDFDLIVLDIRMPFFSGLWFCDALKCRPQTKNTPVLIVSGLPAEENMQKAYRLGASAYLKKPFRSDELLQVVKKLLSGAGGAETKHSPSW